MPPKPALTAVEKKPAVEKKLAEAKPPVFNRRNGVALSPSDPEQRSVIRGFTQVQAEHEVETADRAMKASIAMDPAVQAAYSMRVVESYKPCDGPGINELAYELEKQCAAVRAGDMSRVEEMLLTQAHTLDFLFGKFTRLAAGSRAEYPEAFERYMRLALKSQSQCRSALEALSEIKNPPSVMFARQANIANGPQQVNNGEPSRAREEKAIPANKLLEGVGIGGERLDPGTARQAGASYSALEAVGARHRPQDSDRQG